MKLFATTLNLVLLFALSAQALSGAGAGRHAGIRAAGKENRVMGNLPPREHMKRRDAAKTDWKKRSNNSLNRLRMEKKQRKRVALGAMPALGLTVRMVGQTENQADENDGHFHKRSIKEKLAPEDGRLHKRAKSSKLAPEDGRNHKKRARTTKYAPEDGRNHKRRTTIPDDSRLRHRTLFEAKKRMTKRTYPKQGSSSSNDTSYSKDEGESRNAVVSAQPVKEADESPAYGSDSTETATTTAEESTPTVVSNVPEVYSTIAEESSMTQDEESSSSSSAKHTKTYEAPVVKETPSTKNTGSYSGSGYSSGSKDTSDYSSGSGSGSSGSGSSSGSSGSSGGSKDTSSYSGSKDTSSYSGSSGSSGSSDVSYGSGSGSSGSSSTTTTSTVDEDDEDCEDDDDEDTLDDEDDDEDCDDSEDTEATTTTSTSTSNTDDYSDSGSVSAAAPESTSSSSSSSSSSSGGLTYSGPATYYLQNNNAGSCGNKAQDSDMVVAIKTMVYDAGAKCGDKVTLTNTSTGETADAIVADTCPTCEGDGIDLSEGLFKALSGNNLGAGVVQVKYVIASA